LIQIEEWTASIKEKVAATKVVTIHQPKGVKSKEITTVATVATVAVVAVTVAIVAVVVVVEYVPV
jgi:hypothetical protein